jgi:UDP-N-acetylglucosamine:LPS N-acetylglucosamine transferase
VRLGLDPQRPTGLVLFGGHGSKAMLGIARRLAATTQLILICGHNKALAARLRQIPQVAPRLVVEFTSDIPYYMQLADFFIGKPGPGSISEAVRQGLPVIVVDNAWTMPQERYNAEWVHENGLGVVHGSFRTIDRAVAQLLSRFDTFQANVGRIDNQALFEIPVVLARIVDQASGDMRQTVTMTSAGCAEPMDALTPKLD